MSNETVSEKKLPRERAMSEAFRINYGECPDEGLLHELLTEYGGQVLHQVHDSVEISVPDEHVNELVARYCEADVKATMTWIREHTLQKLRAELSRTIWDLDEYHAQLASLHAQLADLLPPDSVEGDNARRYAIVNARMARLDDYVDQLMEKYITEQGVTEHFHRWALGDNWNEGCHQRCVSTAAVLQNLMATTDVEETATQLAFAALTVHDAAKLIEGWERATGEHPPWELQEAVKAVTMGLDTILEQENGDPMEFEAVVRELQRDVQRLLARVTYWVSYHSIAATQNAIAARRFKRVLATAEQRNEELLGVLESIAAAESLEEAQLLAARELAVTEQVEPKD